MNPINGCHRFAGKVALISGGAGAIGSAAARRFPRKARAWGYSVVIETAGRLADELGRNGAQASRSPPMSVRKRMSTAPFRRRSPIGPARRTLQQRRDFGQGRAGLRTFGRGLGRDIGINLHGIFLVQRAALRAMIAGKTQGSIVNMSSSMAGWDMLTEAAAMPRASTPCWV